jgi:hypothetical protein
MSRALLAITRTRLPVKVSCQDSVQGTQGWHRQDSDSYNRVLTNITKYEKLNFLKILNNTVEPLKFLEGTEVKSTLRLWL